MTTNPGEIVRTRARNGGRASVQEANGWCQVYSTGLLSGVGVTENSEPNMSVTVGGSIGNPDIVIAETPLGNKVALDLAGQESVELHAPSANSQIQSIVAYTTDISLPSSDTEKTGSPSSCGLIVVEGTPAQDPVAPDDDAIRKKIAEDAQTGGSQAAYATLAEVKIATGASTIQNSDITVNNATMLAPKLGGKIVACGTEKVTTIKANGGDNKHITIPTQKDTNYCVLLTKHYGPNGGYKYVDVSIRGKETNSFWIDCWNTASSNFELTIDYIIVRTD